MGKKSKKAAKAALSEAQLSIESLESLLGVLLAEYIQVNTSPSGRICSSSVTIKGNRKTIEAIPLCHFQSGCPQNLNEFIKASDGTTMKASEALGWWARTRLKYSCSMLCVSIVKELIPALQAKGIQDLLVSTLQQRIRLDDLEIMSIAFLPESTHEIVFKSSFLPSPPEIVEALRGDPPHCPHNVLRCNKTGIVVDVALGQFLGNMQPFVFASMDKFIEKLPGKFLGFTKTSDCDIYNNMIRTIVQC